MKIEKRSGSYRVQKMINGKRYSLTFDEKPTKKEIEQKVNEIKNSSVTQLNAPRKTFEQCVLEYLSVKNNVLSASTMRSYKGMLNAMDDDFKSKSLAEIDQIAVQKYINDLSVTHKPKSVKNQHGFISAVLNMFMPGVKLNTTLPKVQKDEPYIPTSEDIKAVLEQCKIEKYRIVFLLGANGLRRSEILALTLDDVGENFVNINKAMVYSDQHEWIVQPFNKTVESTRIVPIDESLSKAIHEQGFIYQGHPRKIMEYLESCQKRAGVPHFKFHSLRHFYATELMRVGTLTQKDIQKLGGWSSNGVLEKIYQHERISKDKEKQQIASAHISNLLK